MKFDQRFLWGFVLLLLFPALAQANSGSNLMNSEVIHLGIGSGLIGILEGMILSLAFRADRWKSILVMIGGNFFSGYLGLYILRVFGEKIFEIDVNIFLLFIDFGA